jgi:hypothetical protein
VTEAALASAVVASPVVLHQYRAWGAFCNAPNSASVGVGVGAADLLLPARPWCGPPGSPWYHSQSVYKFVEKEYWGLAPFAYWTLRQVRDSSFYFRWRNLHQRSNVFLL